MNNVHHEKDRRRRIIEKRVTIIKVMIGRLVIYPPSFFRVSWVFVFGFWVGSSKIWKIIQYGVGM